MKVLIFLDLFFYMEHTIFLGIIANRSFSLLSSEWVIKINGLLWAADIGVHVVHASRVIIA